MFSLVNQNDETQTRKANTSNISGGVYSRVLGTTDFCTNRMGSMMKRKSRYSVYRPFVARHMISNTTL